MEIYLLYQGQAALPGVPARHLTRAEAEKHGVQRLLDSGLYVRFSSHPESPPPKQGRGSFANKSSHGGSENKEE